MMAGLLVWFYLELSVGDRDLGLAERVLAGVEAVWPLAVILTCSRSQSRARTRTPARPVLALRAKPRQAVFLPAAARPGLRREVGSRGRKCPPLAGYFLLGFIYID